MNLVHSKNLLSAAQGRSEFVVAVFADIRGFSKFSRANESPNIAMYVKRLYLELLEKFFSTATYCKPTGDGLLLIFSYDENSLREVFQAVVSSCLHCHSEFRKICRGDAMLNFTLPEAIGFGIARGTACCLFSKSPVVKDGDGGLEQIIDYSGHLLNLAARLNDVARPSGVVVDGSFQNGLLSEEQKLLFSSDKVYLRGVAESSPIEVLVQKGVVTVPNSRKIPLIDENWIEESKEFTSREFSKLQGNYIHLLNFPALSAQAIQIKVHFQIKNAKGYTAALSVTEFQYIAKPKPEIVIAFDYLRNLLADRDLKRGSEVTLLINYLDAPH